MRKLKRFLPIMMAAVLLSACGGKQAESETPQESSGESVVQEEVQEPETKEEKKTDSGSIADRVTKRTYVNRASDANFIIDFVEYPDWDSGMGKLEKVESKKLYLGVSYYTPAITEHLYEEAKLENVTQLTDIPVVMERPIADIFDEVKPPMGGSLAILDFQRIDYTSIEEVGEVNGYQLCRFEGNYVFIDSFTDKEKEINYKIVGYTTFLKNSGNPIYAVAMDVSEDQSCGDRLEDLAYDCISSLYDMTEEEMDVLAKELGITF